MSYRLQERLAEVVGPRVSIETVAMAADPQDSLTDVARRGYCTDEWHRWQQGQCGTYAHALTKMRRGLKMGVAGHLDDEDGSFEIGHVFAHDKTHAYDSAGKHPLPYLGIHHQFTHHELNQNPTDYEFPEEESGPEGPVPNVRDAMAHASRNGILEGRYGAKTPIGRNLG